MKELMKNALILCGITVVAGLLLGAVYEITKSPRNKQQEILKTNAYREVLENADKFEKINVDLSEIKKILEENGITEKNVLVNECIKGLKDNNELVGYIVSVTSKEGYGGNISLSVGFTYEGKVTGVSILSINETAGLGMNAKEDSFLSRYEKDGEGMFAVNRPDSEDVINIDSISGATITSNAVTKGVNAGKLTVSYLIENENSSKETSSVEGGETDE